MRAIVAIGWFTLAFSAAAQSSTDFPPEAVVAGSIIQLLAAADGGKPALVVRCSSCAEHTCPSEIVILVDHPDAGRLRIVDRIDVRAAFDSPYTYRGVGGEEIRAAIYKVRSDATHADKPK